MELNELITVCGRLTSLFEPFLRNWGVLMFMALSGVLGWYACMIYVWFVFEARDRRDWREYWRQVNGE